MEARLPPKSIAEIGTPFGSSHSGAHTGLLSARTVKRALGCAAGVPLAGVQSSPLQSVRWAGGSDVIPSHQMSPSSVSAVLVKMVDDRIVSIALGLVVLFVPGATPKKPASGLIAYSLPSSPKRIQHISSPIVCAFHPGIVGTIIARFVLPHAEGNAPVM